MLRASYTPMVSDQDQLIFDILVPAAHYLRQLNALVILSSTAQRWLLATAHPMGGPPTTRLCS